MCDWSDEKAARLVELWPTHSASEIGALLGVSKNAIIGKARRLGLEKGETLIVRSERAKAKRLVEKPVVEKPAAETLRDKVDAHLAEGRSPREIAALTGAHLRTVQNYAADWRKRTGNPYAPPPRAGRPGVEEVAALVEAPPPGAKPFLRLKPGQCKWPYGDAGDMLFCAEPIAPGAKKRGLPCPYCEAHARLAYVGLPKKKADRTVRKDFRLPQLTTRFAVGA